MEGSQSKALKEFKPVPRQMAEWVKKSGMERTINDQVEDVHIALVDEGNQEYLDYLDAVYDEQAVEGSLSADNTLAAKMIRDEAVKRNVPRIAQAKLATIVKALGVVLRRYGVSRAERKRMLHGEVNGGGSYE